MEGIKVLKVDKDTVLAKELLLYVRNCSWLEAKDHIASNIETWTFKDWETMFVATSKGKIIGMCSLLKEDYYPIKDIYPWVSSIFVSESHRGHKISKDLIDFANDYALSMGFTKTYIPTPYKGLYEHYGYKYVKDIVNYGGDNDHLYVKELK